jgi:signal transduction histidine kinase/ActR/RegA family two-component response regulator
MNQKVKTSFGQTKNGRPFRAVVMLVLLWSFLVPACEAGVLPKMPAACFAFMADSLGNGNAGWYALGAVLSGLAVALAVRWAYRWRQRVLQQRDDEIFQLIDEWTKSLQQEVAERKQAQRALQESHELITRQERLAAVGQLTAGLAHEFNNIMTIVQGHASLLMDNPGLDEDSVNSLGHITDGVDRMAKLVRQMLAFSRKQVMQLKALDLSGTVAGTSIMLGGVLGERVALRLEAAPQLPPVMADPDMVQQVMVNLAVNARDAMPDGGELTIRTSEANFAATDVPAQSERKAGRFVRLSVTDTGSGMEPGTIKHLFEPFFTTKEVGKGPGLGLATVYGIVSQHQGWIEVQSKVELGTTFDLYFPVTDQMPERPVKQEAPPEVRGGKETVLVVEDELVLRELVREILTAHGYRVLEAANGLEALETWEEHRDKVDLLLTDIAMPHGLSGRDLAIKLRKDAPQLPVIFSSGYSQEMIERNDGADQGATFLSKPYNPVQLAHSVRHALDAAAQREHQMAANAPQPVERP